MPGQNPRTKLPVAGVSPQAITQVSMAASNQIASVRLSGINSAQILGLTGLTVTSTGATAAACVTVTITGISSAQVSGGVLTYVFGVPAGAGVPAIPLDLAFSPPLYSTPGGAIVAEMSALGSGHARATMVANGEVFPR